VTGASVFRAVLIANRGEISVRITRTLRALGIRSIAVYSDADRDARHVRVADAAVRIGPAPAPQSYLDVERIVDAALGAGADAIHPGYGFLAENPRLGRACEAAGLVFVGPPARAIETMGDKIRAKETVEASGVPVVPGVSGAGLDDAALAKLAADLGFPLLVKPSAGGGGKGMRLVESADTLADALAAARREARGAFGDDTLLVERFVARPRHVEVQVLADAHGTVVHLGERECSLQRRHQKVIEEAPSPLLSDAQRDAVGAQAIAAARACGYVNAGTVEFIVPGDRPDDAFFMEMNTRLQVEHPVTEMVWGVDLVEQQLRIAAGEPLSFPSGSPRPRGHAIEARIYAEDPAHGFLPTGGTVHLLREPDGMPDVRVDSSLLAGRPVTTDYDPMLSKVVAWGADRETARRRLDDALARTRVLGVTTNVSFLRTVLADRRVVAGDLDTGLLERIAVEQPPATVPPEPAIAAALLRLDAREPAADPWADRRGWRLGPPAPVSWYAVAADGMPVEVILRASPAGPDAWEAALDGGEPVPVRAAPDGDGLLFEIGGRSTVFTVAAVGATVWVAGADGSWSFTEPPPTAPGTGAPPGGEATITSPMPGTVVAVNVAPGAHVTEGQAVVVVEAMKMEHTLRAPCAAVVREVRVRAGDPVALHEVLAVLDAD